VSRVAASVPFTIGVVSKITGQSPDTLRVWEKRYGFPTPSRQGKSVRVYSDHDVQKLRVASELLRLGYRPGDVLGRPIEELLPLLEVARGLKPKAHALGKPPTFEQVIQWLLRYDVEAIASTLSKAKEFLGLKQFVREFARPLLAKVGVLWAEGNLEVRHEHLLSDLVGTELRTTLATHRNNSGPRVLLATLDGEQHGLGLELWAVDLAAQQMNTYILGTDSPIDQIAKTAAAMDVHIVAVYVSGAADLTKSGHLLDQLILQLPRRVGVWLGGGGADLLKAVPQGAVRFGSYDDFDAEVTELSRLKTQA
jgi:MerR family transcriptional regulator, light-induced transcriptional regulator